MIAADFPYQHSIAVTFRDLDAMGHVNNAVYFTYLETARLHYLTHLLSLPDIRQIPVIMANASCSYKSPLFFGEAVLIGLGISRMGTKSFIMQYVVETSSGRVAATAETVQVMYDYAAAQTIPIPEWVRQRVQVVQNGWAGVSPFK